MTVEDVTVDFASTQVAFGNGGLLGLQLSSIAFTDDNSSQDIIAKFTLLQAEEVPEPDIIAIFGIGLLGLSLVRPRARKYS